MLWRMLMLCCRRLEGWLRVELSEVSVCIEEVPQYVVYTVRYNKVTARDNEVTATFTVIY
jgi:hypothetical protein